MPVKSYRILTVSLALAALAACQHVAPLRSEAGRGEAGRVTPSCPGDATRSETILTLEKGPVEYTACAGTIRVTDTRDGPLADLFYTAYMLPSDKDEPRPIAFVWNGGPGADSRLLHFRALGPKTLQAGQLADNTDSPLPAADLVFLDPAGTGFSRASSDEAARTLYSTTGDIAATAQFIRRFLAAQGRTASPLYLVGESFGTWRASGVAEALLQVGQPVAGIALISGGIPMGEERDRALMRALSLPNRTATALALGKLDTSLSADPAGALASSELWARDVWYPALAAPQSLTFRQRQEVVTGLARFMGLAPSRIDSATLWVSPRDFRQGLLADEGKTLGIFDMRRTQAEEGDSGADAVLAYYRRALGFRDGKYAGIEVPALPVGRDWQYDQAPITKESLARAMAGEGPPSPSQPWVLRALEMSPTMRVLVATGLYDSLNGCAANREAANRFPAPLAKQIDTHCYRGGHMMYEDSAEAVQFADDLKSFFTNADDARKLE
ncbi:S10 family serine carboxypeptidase-like protein [Novosphingobium mathurense]|uniref:Carboxypeptidase C (Cathepsin A) n=1 Tax=Novosphingobium mathurense TaxID=428990 RepID=A0A1U6I410_9SPHN|nr:peptidase S10 [Novosphingobium mathurense]SLK02733.1 Carboxypeptidase C (cathepsin A) [Novosphingobium mathurense]